MLTKCLNLIAAFLKKQVWNWSPCLIFCMIFKEKCFSHYILLYNWLNFITRLPLLLEILKQYVYCHFFVFQCVWINFEIYLSFLIKLFSDMTKKSGQKFKDLKNKKSFQHEIKSIFHHFKNVFSSQTQRVGL